MTFFKMVLRHRECWPHKWQNWEDSGQTITRSGRKRFWQRRHCVLCGLSQVRECDAG